MTDLVSTEEAEDRLRRTFARRAERLAALGIEADEGAGGAGGALPAMPLAGGGSEDPGPSVARRAVLAAAAVAAVVGIGVAAAASSRGGDDGGADVGTGPADGPAATTASPTTAPPESPPTTCPPVTVPPDVADIVGRSLVILGSYLGDRTDGDPSQITIEQTDAFTLDTTLLPGAERVRVGDHEGWLLPGPNPGSEFWMLHLEFGDQIVTISAVDVDRERVLDFAASVRPEGDSFTYDPPAGMTLYC